MKTQIGHIEPLETGGFRNSHMELNKGFISGQEKVEQKLEYFHLNPLQEKWDMVKFPEDYHWSSAKFYDTGEDEFGILTHYMYRFG